MLKQGFHLAKERGDEGRVLWLTLGVTYLLLCRASELRACSSDKIRKELGVFGNDTVGFACFVEMCRQRWEFVFRNGSGCNFTPKIGSLPSKNRLGVERNVRWDAKNSSEIGWLWGLLGDARVDADSLQQLGSREELGVFGNDTAGFARFVEMCRQRWKFVFRNASDSNFTPKIGSLPSKNRLGVERNVRWDAKNSSEIGWLWGLLGDARVDADSL